MSQPLVYLNGEMLPASEARLAVYDAGVVMGATVTDMVRTFHKRLYRLADHLDRFAKSLNYVRFDVGVTTEQLASIGRDLVEHNAALAHDDDELGLVYFATAGEIAAYAAGSGNTARQTPTLCAHTFPLSFGRFAESMERGLHVVTPATRHVPPECYDPKVKCRSRMHYYLADQEARLVDSDAVALLLDLSGNVTETSGANFLIVENGRVVSPTTRNTLPGVSRLVVAELAEELGMKFVEDDRQIYSVMNADEAFTASTPCCLMPVTRINGSPIGDGKPGPVFEKLIAAWSNSVGLDIRRQIIDGAARQAAV